MNKKWIKFCVTAGITLMAINTGFLLSDNVAIKGTVINWIFIVGVILGIIWEESKVASGCFVSLLTLNKGINWEKVVNWEIIEFLLVAAIPVILIGTLFGIPLGIVLGSIDGGLPEEKQTIIKGILLPGIFFGLFILFYFHYLAPWSLKRFKASCSKLTIPITRKYYNF